MAVPNRGRWRPWVVTMLVALGAWWAVALTIAGRDAAGRIADLVAGEVAVQTRTNTGVAYSIAAGLRHLRGIPLALAGDAGVMAATASFGAGIPTSSLPVAERRRQWESRPDLAALDRHLSDLVAAFGVDIVWVLDAAGDCIAASNSGHAESFVGTTYADRDYYIAIRAGHPGRQFAVGRQTNTPGLFFSAPVIEGGKVVGGVVVKVDLTRLSHWVEQGNTVITDEYGIVIAASDPALLFTAFPGASWATRDSAFLEARYKRDQFVPTDIRPFGDGSHPELVVQGASAMPMLMTSSQLVAEGLAVHMVAPFPEVNEVRNANRRFLLSLLLVGSLTLMLVLGGSAFIVDTHRNVRLLEEKNATLARLSREADAANAAKSRFLATMSHELRTPFTGILGMVELLQGTELPGDAPQQLRLLERSARVLLGLLNDLLDFSKIEAGELTIERVAFDLAPILSDLVQLYGGIATAKGVLLKLDPIEPSLIGLGDPFRLRQVIANFLSNAVKFTSQGSVSLGAGIVEDGGSQRRLVVSVTDTGPGIKPEVAERLFQPFSQGDVSTSRNFGGTGLGLAISKRIAEAMDGDVGLESVEGAGATFWIRIPFEATPLPPVNIHADSGTSVKTTGKTGRRVLIADDDEVNRQVIGGMLRRAGHLVTAVEDGRRAVDAVAAEDFDLVFMDMQMPVMDGPEATRAIRALPPPGGGIPIIGLTADALTENRAAYLQAGLNELLTKPIRAADLNAAVDRLSRGGRGP